MRRPIWFRPKKNGLGWTPSAWQGWAVIGIFIAFLAFAIASWTRSAPGQIVLTSLVFVALLVTTAALTSGNETKKK